MPVVRPHPDRPDRRLVTFVWTSGEDLAAVHLLMNRVTDKDDFGRGRMHRVPGTGRWELTLDLDARLRASYAFYPIPAGPDAERLLDSVAGHHPAIPPREDQDPQGPGLRTDGRGPHSVLSLDLAPRQSEWEPGPGTVPAGTVSRMDSPEPVAGRARPLWSYLPAPTDAELGLLVLLDAEKWFGGLQVHHALDRAIAAGRIAPMAVLGIENLGDDDRLTCLGAGDRLLDDLASSVLPRFRRRHPERAWRGREATVLCGQSLGGVTALNAAVRRPECFGAAISHSPSMWWRPDHSTRPTDLPTMTDSWIADALLEAPVADTRLRCAVGQLESGTVGWVRSMTDGLRLRGWDARLARYVGGHDYAWWRGALIDDLEDLTPGRLRPARRSDVRFPDGA